MLDPITVCFQLPLALLFAKRTSSAIGNARPFGLQEKYLEYCPRILEHPSATFADRKVVAEIHLYHITLRLQSDNQTQFREGGYEEIERWKMNWVHLMGKPPLAPSRPYSD